MAIVASEYGEILLLQYMLGYANNPGLKMHLYDNNWSPQSTDTASNYTEVSDPAYHTTTLVGGLWTASVVSGVATAWNTVQRFSLSQVTSVYGYFVSDNYVTPHLVWAEAFDTGPINIPPGGDQILISPSIQLQ